MIKLTNVRPTGARHNKAGPAKGTEARTQAKRIKSSLLGLLTLTTATMSTIAIQATTAGAIDVTQSNVGANVNCALNGLHQNTGPVSTCYDISIRTEILVNGAVALPGASMQPGDVVTVRLTVIEEGGQNSFYEETVDGIRNNEVGGASDIQGYFNVTLPTQTGAQLGNPTGIMMSRSDSGDRGSGPAINCALHSGQESAVSDPLTAITLGGPAVGGTDMMATVSGGVLRGTWDDMAWDRCRGLLSNNGLYPGHVLEFQQTVLTQLAADQTLTWGLGQFTMARDDASRTITWGQNANQSLLIAAGVDSDGDGVLDADDPDDADPCNPNVNAGPCDQDNDGLTNDEETAAG